jgi:hypothetical protein
MSSKRWEARSSSELSSAVVRRATVIFRRTYHKDPERVRDKIYTGPRGTRRPWRTYLNKYPCGILEQAYREPKEEVVSAATA